MILAENLKGKGEWKSLFTEEEHILALEAEIDS